MVEVGVAVGGVGVGARDRGGGAGGDGVVAVAGCTRDADHPTRPGWGYQLSHQCWRAVWATSQHHIRAASGLCDQSSASGPG